MNSAEDRTPAEIARELKKWIRYGSMLGLGLILSVACVIPTFNGLPLHRYWETFGRASMVMSGLFFFPFLFAAGTALNLWYYGWSLRRIDRDFPEEEDSDSGNGN
jgi:hypothetical protein